MKSLSEIKKIIQKHKEDLEEKYAVKEIGIFGSCARGEQDETSDIDILIELEKPVGIVKFLKLEKHLSLLLEAKVEIVTKKALKPYIGRQILQEVDYV
ncbi:MAG: polymerase beta domain protein region protein [Candidatus Uhrbacteria bacterium GW2011_GWF2_41_16]|uniref:Polymerase beta domain protein region protein n=1 Tax=Candidatus Uhrbacteria bacterium GW2011_GWF2_41_16 TaxID=1618997 RepID=A0A0G0VCJ1_9BACT|nr:MAG: polymerase beta domain protein region protein [Candidatus Uhrbacteria bacterium GW2011_GWF2_41_16]OHB36126.1 MAG: nucleotidyltransferase [Planctomycetes bacterium GWA2_39_15]